MKSAHFDFAQCKRGFTLVELLVVITIIAILSVIGITVFGGVQKSARDARRRGDIDAMSKAMEVNKGQCSYTVQPDDYCDLKPSLFTSDTVPRDPKDNTTPYFEDKTTGNPAYEGRSGSNYEFCADLEIDGHGDTWDGTQHDYCRSNQQ